MLAPWTLLSGLFKVNNCIRSDMTCIQRINHNEPNMTLNLQVHIFIDRCSGDTMVRPLCQLFVWPTFWSLGGQTININLPSTITGLFHGLRAVHESVDGFRKKVEIGNSHQTTELTVHRNLPRPHWSFMFLPIYILFIFWIANHKRGNTSYKEAMFHALLTNLRPPD